MRRSLFLVLLLSTVFPAIARAQNPLADCKTFQKVEREEFSYPLVPGTDNVHQGRLAGSVRVDCDDMTLFADEIRWRDDSDMVYANGDVHYQQKGTYISAERAEMNRRTHLGTFFEASGTLELLDKKPDKSLFGTQEPDAMFAAEKIEKIADRTYKLTRATWTTCLQPTPRWDMTASTVVLVSGDHATLKNMVLRVKDVPMFYIPAIYYPTKHEDRATGFLLPNYGASTIRGLTLNTAFFWAIDRSRDATFYYDYLSKAGQGLGGEYRYAADRASSGDGRIYMLNQSAQYSDDADQTLLRPAHRTFDIRGNVNQAVSGTMRLNAHVNYFTDVETQQLYQQNIYDMSQRRRSIGAQITGGAGRYRWSGQFDVNDVFYGTQASRIGQGPFGSLSVGEKPIGSSRVYFGVTASGGQIIREENIEDPLTDRSLWRVDASPRVTIPVSNLPALTTTASATWRLTFWSESFDPVLQTRLPDGLAREFVDLQLRSVGPVFSRVYRTPQNGYADGFKHLVEPNFTIDWISPYNDSAKIIQLDGTDTVVTGTTTMTYGVANRLLAKKRLGTPVGQPAPAGGVREVLTVGISQTYYTNSLAAQYDPNYQSSFNGLYQSQASPSPFSPVQISAVGRPTDTTSAQFRMEYDTRFNAVRTYNASGSIDEPRADITAGWTKRQVIPGLSGFDDPNSANHFLNLAATIKARDNSIGGTYMFNYDVLNAYFLQRRYRFYYNSQCCGVAFDYQTVDTSHFSGFAPSDRRISIAFTLAGIGSFSSPLGSFAGGTSAH